VLIATDVLSEGQNLQDCAIVVNFDLPWAIIRLIQRAGRVDRIGQQSADPRLLLPPGRGRGADHPAALARAAAAAGKRRGGRHGRGLLRGSGPSRQAVCDLYNESAGILDGDEDAEVDLASYAYQIWKNATDANPEA
jgi:hypothetical protein